MSDEETVVEQENKAASEEPAKSEDAQVDDLDALLSEFETETKSETKAETEEKDSDVAGKVKALEARLAQQDFQTVVSRIKGNLDVDTDVVEGWVEAKARKNKALATAYANRFDNPEKWAQVERSLSKDLAKIFPGKVDQEATDIHESVTAAVRSASTKTSDSADEVPKDIPSWPDWKFEQWKKEQSRKRG